MNLYLAKATCDWGNIYYDEQVKASSFGTAFQRAGKQAQKQARRRPKQISVSIRLVGKIQKEAAREGNLQ